jgi:flavodoxin
MKAIVAYFSQTGNTRKVAEAIYEGIQCEKEIKQLEEADNINDYDLIFVGFPIQAFGPAQQGKDFLENRCQGRKVALFMTHASPEDFESLPEWLAACRESAAGADVVGMFNCQGELDDALLEVSRTSDDPEFRKLAELAATSKGQPDATRLERARTFAGEMTA